MNKNLLFLTALALGTMVSFTSCKKNNDGCDGGNLCFTIDGKDVSVTASRTALPNGRFRIHWEEGSGNNYKNVELDIFGSTVAEYDFLDNPGVSGDAGFQYYINDNGTETNYQSTSGTVNLTSIANDKWSGTFSGTVTNGASSFQLSDGKFVDVVLE